MTLNRDRDCKSRRVYPGALNINSPLIGKLTALSRVFHPSFEQSPSKLFLILQSALPTLLTAFINHQGKVQLPQMAANKAFCSENT